MSSYTLSQTNGRFNSLKFDTLFQNPYQYKIPGLSKDTKKRLYEAYQASRRPAMEPPVPETRSLLDRALDGLQVFNYTLAGGINNLIDDDKDTTFWGGVRSGLKAANPFGKGYEPGEITFSNVLHTAGWQPESGLGKFARGTVGFLLDVALDPTTYLGGTGLLVKGTGVVGSTAKALDNVAKDLPAHLLDSKGKLTKMTDEVAEYILKNNPEKAKELAKLSGDDLAGVISDFTRNYNRALGIREVGEITFGLKNAPFGEWAVRKLGMKRGEITIAKSNKGLMQIGKYSGLSHIYGYTRNFLMGTKMIQKLSKTARYAQLAKANPIELFDAVGYLKTAKGRQQSIRRGKQNAILGSEALSKLDPATQKLIIQLQEDPAMWKIVEGIYDDGNTKTFDEFRQAYSKDLEELLEKRALLEDTYESIKASDEARIKDFSSQVEAELRRRSEINREIKELEYNIDWLKAEREKRIADLRASQITSQLDIDKLRIKEEAINKEYDDAIEQLTARRSEIENAILDMADYLGKERSFEFSPNGFDLVKATPEMIEEEMNLLAQQHEDALAKIDEMIKARQISFEEAQQAREDLSLQLKAEAKRIYGRQYYQAKKAINLEKELEAQEKALDEVTKAIENLRKIDPKEYSADEVALINDTIKQLTERRNSIRSQINELSSSKRIEEVKAQLEREEQILSGLLSKSFGTKPTRFDNMSFEEIQNEFATTLREMLIEDADNEQVIEMAKRFALMSDEQAEALAKKLGLEEGQSLDFRAIIGNAYDSREIAFVSELRNMFSELLLGRRGLIHPPKNVVINMARFIMTDANNTEALMKYFTSTKDNIYNRILTGREALEAIEKIRVAGHIPVMREALVDNYAMFSGNSVRFFKQLASSLGYKYFSDVKKEMSNLNNLIKEQQGAIDKALELAKTAKDLPVERIIDNIVDELGLSKEELLGHLGMVKPLPQYKSQAQELGRLQALIEAEYATGRSIDEVNAEFAPRIEQLQKEHELYLKEKQFLDNYPVKSYETNDEFFFALEEALYKMHPQLENAYKRFRELVAKSHIYYRESKYFFALDDVAQAQYLEFAEQDKRFGEFIQSMYEQELERLRGALLEESSAFRQDMFGNITNLVSRSELQANLGATKIYSYDEIVESIPEGEIRSLYYNVLFGEYAKQIPKAEKQLIDELNEKLRINRYGTKISDGSAPNIKGILDYTPDGDIKFLREVIGGGIKNIDLDGANKHIDNWLETMGKGMDKRTKPYRELKQRAEKARQAVKQRKNLLDKVNQGENIFKLVDEKTLTKIFESLGTDRLFRINNTRKAIFESSNGKWNGAGGINESVDKIIRIAKSNYDSALKSFNDAIETGSKDVEQLRTLLRRAADELEEATILKALMDYRVSNKDKIINKPFINAIGNLLESTKILKETKSAIIDKHVTRFIGTKEEPNLKVAEKMRGVEMVLPFMMTRLHPGKQFIDLDERQKYALVHKTLGIIEKNLGGVVPKTIEELEAKLNTEIINTTKLRELKADYSKFIRKAEDGLHIIYTDENGVRMTGRLVNRSELPEDFDPSVSLKVETLVQNDFGDVNSQIFDVPFDKVIRTQKSAVEDIFNTVDTAVERQLRETQIKLEQLAKDIEANKQKAEDLKPELEQINKEIDSLYKERAVLMDSYYGKLKELEATQRAIQAKIDELNFDKTQALEKQLEFQEKRQELLNDAELVRFEVDDPFAIAVPGTKEWDDLREYIIKNDEEIAELAKQITEDSPKRLVRQFEKLVEQRMLGFAKGDGFKLFQDKVELTNEAKRISDLIGERMQDLAKLQELKIDSQLTKSAIDMLPDARANDIANIEKEIDTLRTSIKLIEQQIDEYDAMIDKTIDGLGAQIEVAKRKKLNHFKQMNDLYKSNKVQDEISKKNLETLERDMQKLNDEIAKLEDALSTNEALENYLAGVIGKSELEAVARKSKGLPTFKYAIEDTDIDENVKKWAIWMHEEMRRIGIEEVKIGKLNPEAFKHMINSYFPRVLSEEGERFFAENQELLDKIRPLTSDYGFGTKFNNHGISRIDELRDKSIYEVNDYFESEYGVRIFEEELARAYIGRMMKHAELMYDDHYTKTMMDLFGYEVPSDLSVKEGYVAVANMGHVRQYIKELVELQIQMERNRGNKEISKEMIAKFESQAIEQLGLTPEQLDDYKLPMIPLKGESLYRLQKVGLARQMNKYIVEEANMARLMTIDRDNSRMLTLFDKFTTWIKAMQTAVMPSFHARNFMSNMFQNWLAVGAEAFSPRMARDSWAAARAMGNREKLRALKPINPIDPNKPVIHWEKIWDEAVIHGVIDEGFFAKDFDGHATSSGIFGGGKWDFTSTENFAPIKAGFKVGTLVENQGRLAQFATHLKYGKSFEEAADLVRNYLFDYSDLTLFEKRYLKRIFPYYTWMRKNSVLQVRELIEQPQKYALVGKFMQSMENSADPDNELEDKYISDYARDWMITPFTMTVRRTNAQGEPYEIKEPILFSPNLPFMDIARLPDPFNLFNSFQNFFSQTTPVAKVPLESLLNYNTHFDSPIVKENSNPLTANLNHALSTLAWYNAVKSMANADTSLDFGLAVMNSAVGIKASSYDYEANKRATVERAWEEYLDKSLGYYLKNGQALFTDAITWEARTALSKSIIKLAGLPKTPGEYSGVLAPISAETYESLPEEEKKKYEMPTTGEVGYYNKRAIELSKQAYQEAGLLKKFAWMLLDVVDVPYKNQIQVVRVNEVIDGDTLSVSVDGVDTNVRLLLVDTPESVGKYKDNPMAFGKEASDFTKQMALGKDAKIYFDGYDSHGRMLGFVEVGNTSINEELIREGLGKVRYLYERDNSNADVQYYRQLEQEAIDNKKGIWSIPGYAEQGDTDFEGGRSSR